ncbi:MAG: macro domain-containing protein [Oscillospiraceae bacterium]|nr:macro domain-containing protein [Oscillospiraceae bacterium]
MPFQIIRNDITKVAADAIVNSAVPKPLVGLGTDYAIHKAAGPELLEARKKIGDIQTGQSISTPAFQLQAKYVLHTVSPVWIDGQHGEEEDLRKAYESALMLAYKLKCKSVAFPLLSAGTYAFPYDLALSVAIRAFTDFLLNHKMQIFLVLFNSRAFDIAGSLFSDLKSYVDDNYVDQRRSEVELSWNLRENEDRRRLKSALAEQMEARERVVAHKAERVTSLSREEGLHSAEQKPIGSLKDVLREPESSFSEYMLELIKSRGMTKSEVYRRAEVSRQLFSNICNNKNYQPTKSTAVQLAIGMQLDMEQTQQLLNKAGYALSRSSKTDLVVQYYIERQMYSIPFINEALLDSGLPLLSTGLVR